MFLFEIPIFFFFNLFFSFSVEISVVRHMSSQLMVNSGVSWKFRDFSGQNNKFLGNRDSQIYQQRP